MMKQKKKEKYEKPELKTIQLHAEEVLAIGCKSIGSSGPDAASCGLLSTQCSASGS
jgi:hypothetical protein